jgi:nucleoid-associated protein YgaU
MTDKGIALKAPPPEKKKKAPPPEKQKEVPDVWTSPQRAYLEMWEPERDEDGQPKLGTSQGRIKFQFNPKEVSITKSGKWEWKTTNDKNAKAPPVEYSGAEPCKLTLELFFDSAVDPDINVVDSVDDLFRCCVPTEKSIMAEMPLPFLVVFNWGSVTSFAAYISQVQATYTRFAPNGIPIRAVCTVNLEEIDVTPAPKQNPTSGCRSADRVHTMVTGDSLALVAYREYGNPELWRPLAAYNDIDDPMRISDGTRVSLPKLDALFTAIG